MRYHVVVTECQTGKKTLREQLPDTCAHPLLFGNFGGAWASVSSSVKDATVVRQLCPFCPVVVVGGTPDPNWWCWVNRRRALWVSQSLPNTACGALSPTQARVGPKSGNLAPGRPKHPGDESGQGGSVLYGPIWQRSCKCSGNVSGWGTDWLQLSS